MDSLTAQINSVLAQYTKNVNQTMLDVLNETAKDGVKMLKEKSREAFPEASGKYAKSWAVKRVNGTFTIYNKKPGLTHLLENGHDIVRNGKKVGRAKAHPHIKDVDEWIEKTVVERLEKSL